MSIGAEDFQDLAILAGQGVLPRLLADQAARISRNYCVVKLHTMELSWTQAHPCLKIELERIHTGFTRLHKRGIKNIVVAGAAQRPERLNPLRFDLKTALNIFHMHRGLAKGDDGTLRILLQMLGDAGFKVVAAQDLLPDLLADAGSLSKTQPNRQDHQDIAFAVDILDRLSPLDLGQGCVIAKRRCLSLESHFGTDAMLNFVAQHHNTPPRKKRTGVLVKIPKLGQDLRIDLPAIGVQTVHNVVQAGLAGIAVPCAGALLLERDKIIAAADAARVFIYAMPERNNA